MVRGSLKGRQIWVYLPTEADRKRWQALAESKSSTLSSYVFETVEKALENRPPPMPLDSNELINLRKDVSKLKKENEQLLKMNSQLMETYKSSIDATPRIEALETSVKALMQKGGTWTDKKLRKELMFHIQFLQLPLSRVMHNLMDQGLVEEVVGGFRWKAKPKS